MSWTRYLELRRDESLEHWYKVVTPRKEVREGRSFNPDEFAIALEQVVAGTALGSDEKRLIDAMLLAVPR